MDKQEQIKLWCDFLDEMANWIAGQDTNEDAQFWANSYNAEVLKHIRQFLEVEHKVP